MEPFRFENTVSLTEDQYVAIFSVLPKGTWFKYVRLIVTIAIGVVCLFSRYTLLLGLALLGAAAAAVFVPGMIMPGGTRTMFRRQKFLQYPLTYGVSDQRLWVKGTLIEASVHWTMLVVWREVEGWLVLSPSGIQPLYFSLSRLKQEGLYDRVKIMAKAHGQEYNTATSRRMI